MKIDKVIQELNKRGYFIHEVNVYGYKYMVSVQAENGSNSPLYMNDIGLVRLLEELRAKDEKNT